MIEIGMVILGWAMIEIGMGILALGLYPMKIPDNLPARLF